MRICCNRISAIFGLDILSKPFDSLLQILRVPKKIELIKIRIYVNICKKSGKNLNLKKLN